jgi:hypothetical protein
MPRSRRALDDEASDYLRGYCETFQLVLRDLCKLKRDHGRMLTLIEARSGAGKPTMMRRLAELLLEHAGEPRRSRSPRKRSCGVSRTAGRKPPRMSGARSGTSLCDVAGPQVTGDKRTCTSVAMGR